MLNNFLMNKSLRLDLILFSLAILAQASFAQVKPDKSQIEFQTFLAKLDAAQLELQNGRAETFKSMWSRADDITLSGGFGGNIEKGWTNVGGRLNWVGTRFSNGRNKIERLVSTAKGEIGYVVQIEHIAFNVPGQAKESSRDYRVTMIFRREKGGWRIIHRHADSQMTKQALQ